MTTPGLMQYPHSALMVCSEMGISDLFKGFQSWIPSVSFPRVLLFPHYSMEAKGWALPAPSLDGSIVRRTALLTDDKNCPNFSSFPIPSSPPQSLPPTLLGTWSFSNQLYLLKKVPSCTVFLIWQVPPNAVCFFVFDAYVPCVVDRGQDSFREKDYAQGMISPTLGDLESKLDFFY